jgi:AcrR family transcriptional regulator
MTEAKPDAPTAEDGRVLRGTRNRDRITDALFELIESGELIPTAEQVARKAGVGERTVFRHFADMETLFAELSGRLESEMRPLLEQPAAVGNREERVRAFVEHRAELYERISPFKHSGALQRVHSEFLQRKHIVMNRMLREHLVDALQSELVGAPDVTLEALDFLTSFEAWDRMRNDQHLSRERACQVCVAAVVRVLLLATDGSSPATTNPARR